MTYVLSGMLSLYTTTLRVKLLVIDILCSKYMYLVFDRSMFYVVSYNSLLSRLDRYYNNGVCIICHYQDLGVVFC